MLESCRRPELVTEITLQPVRRHGVDAAIFFSDIVVPLAAVGVDLDIVPGTGPVVARPFRTRADLDRLPELTPEHVPDITESVRLLVAELGATPLIGFAGAPFTLASYLVEGGPSRNHEHTKALMHGDPRLWSRPVRAARADLRGLPAGAGAGRGAASSSSSTPGRAPCRGPTTSASSSPTRPPRSPPSPTWTCRGSTSGSAPASCWRRWAPRAPTSSASTSGSRCATPYGVSGPATAVQGNLDPALLFAPWPVVEQRVREILDEGRDARGHVVNLGHGVLPDTDPDVLTRVVELVHELSAR